MVTSYLIPTSVNLSSGRPLGRDDVSFFSASLPPTATIPPFPLLVVQAYPTLHDRARLRRLLIFFRILNLLSRARTLPKSSTNARTITPNYWYPRNRRPRHASPRPLYIHPRFVLCYHSVPHCPTTGSTDTRLATLLRAVSRPQVPVVFSSPYALTHRCSRAAARI